MGPDPIAAAIALMERLGERVIVQVRERDLEGRALCHWIHALVDAKRRTGAWVMINGRLDVALSFAPEVGLHLPERGLPIEAAKSLLPKETRISAAAHDLETALALSAQGVDLITVSPVFPTPSKPKTLGRDEPVLGLTRLSKIVQAIDRRAEVFALGGIDRSNMASVLAAGVDGLAAIRSAWSAEPLL